MSAASQNMSPTETGNHFHDPPQNTYFLKQKHYKFWYLKTQKNKI